MKKLFLANAAALLLVGVCLSPRPAVAQTFSEPHTVFYGKVLGTGSAQDFLITSGQLTWTIQRADGQSVTLHSFLYDLHDGSYSYRLNVPHSAFALGLDADPSGVPLPPVPEVNVHADIQVDGETATLLGPAGAAFTTEQLLRTSTYRLDLGLGRTAVDTDGDGMADWWEDLYGLNKQDPADAATDPDGDGLSALDAYLRGLDPTRDARSPALLTRELVVYPSGTTGILLDTADLDSTPEQLVYTLTRLPNAGSLSLRNGLANPAQPDVVLTMGDTFTHADLMNGRVIYDHDGSANHPGSFGVEVRDENPAHPAGEGEVGLLAYQPAGLAPTHLNGPERQRLENHAYADFGYVILDGSAMGTHDVALSSPSAGLTGSALDAYRATYGDDRAYVIIGTTLAGGHGDDLLIAAGAGSTVTGGPGADRFVIQSFAPGGVTVADFSPEEGDVIDLSGLPAAPGSYVHEYVQIVQVDGVHQLQTDLDGNGSGFTDLALSAPGLAAEDADLYALIESGRLLVGSLQLQPLLTVAASQPQASENGPTEGQFTIARRGSLDQPLTVGVVISGSAQNGVDYMLAPTQVLIPAGVASVDIPITPYADNSPEATESVQLLISAGTGYQVGAAHQAVVTIEDLLMLVDIEAIEPVAVKDTGAPGLFLLTRSEVVDRDVLVRLTIGGTAANGVDYAALTSFVYLAPNQTVALLQVTPTAGAQLDEGMETVSITIQSDATYRTIGEAEAQVAIIERNDSFAGWRLREFPGSSGDAAAFAQEDSGSTGISHFQRYAFGLDAHQPDPDGLPRLVLHEGQVAVTFRRPLGLTDVQYDVSASADLLQWSAQVLTVNPMEAPQGASDPSRVYYQVEDGPSAGFIRIDAEWMQ